MSRHASLLRGNGPVGGGDGFQSVVQDDDPDLPAEFKFATFPLGTVLVRR
jgi:hypothetical protein